MPGNKLPERKILLEIEISQLTPKTEKEAIAAPCEQFWTESGQRKPGNHTFVSHAKQDSSPSTQ